MEVERKVIKYTVRTIPAANEIINVLDTTYGATQAPSASPTAPGLYAGVRSGYRWEITVRVGDQDVTWEAFLKTGFAKAAADFELDTSDTSGTGTGTITAGDTQPFIWEPTSADARFSLTAGATPPDELEVSVVGYPKQ